MTCHSCSVDCVKAGKYGRKRVQRYLCKLCGKRYSEPRDKPFGAVHQGADFRMTKLRPHYPRDVRPTRRSQVSYEDD